MANRSDRGSVLPRRYKRMISLAPDLQTDEKQSRIVRMLFIKAHAHAEGVRKQALTQKSDDKDDQPTAKTLPVQPAAE